MGKVVAQLAMSLDGFIADPDDGCDDLFGFYDNGDVELVLADGWPTFHMFEPSATLMREEVARTGCHVMGRDLYDMTNGWGGHPGNEAPIVVLTHQAPDQHPDGVPYLLLLRRRGRDRPGPSGRRRPRCRDRGWHGGAAGARRRAARRHRGEPRARGARRGHPVVRRLEGPGATLGPRGARGPRRDPPALRGAEVADSVSRDGSCPGTPTGPRGSPSRPPPIPTCAASGWAARPRRAGTTSGRTSTSTCCARPARRRRSTRDGWRRRGRTSTSATCGRCRSTCGRTAGSASSTSRTGPVCCSSRPGSSTCTSPTCPTSTRTSTYAGTARRSCCTTPTG